jgi:hypothetical protein
MFFSRFMFAIVGLFVAAFPAIAMDADVVRLVFRDVDQETFARSTSCQNQGKIKKLEENFDPQYAPLRIERLPGD